MLTFCIAFSDYGRTGPPKSVEPTVDTTAPSSASPLAVSYVVDNMDDDHTMGSVIGSRYYLSAYNSYHDKAFTNFRRVAASLEAKGWVMVPDSFSGMYGGLFMFTGTFVPSDKREAPAETMGTVPPELILNDGRP